MGALIKINNLTGSLTNASGTSLLAPTIVESPDNTDTDYRLIITDKNGSFTTPNLIGPAGSGGGGEGFSPTIEVTPIEDGYELKIINKDSTETITIKNGVGVPAGGTTGQVLAKVSGTDYDTEWVDQTGGGGSGTPGEDGGYYQPSVDTSGNLTWTASKSDMPAVAGNNIKGPKGDKGDKGDTGPKGDKGEDGTGVSILGSYNSQEELESAHPTGEIGDAYLVNGDLYVWSETSASWNNVGNIKGPKGDKGDDGVTPHIGENNNWFIGDVDTGVQAEGQDGAIGPVGPKGDKGDKGDTGDAGAQGEKGDKGDTGDQGPQGPQGNPGADGFSPIATVTQTDTGATISIQDATGTTTATITNGQDGAQGIQGPQGPQGDSGVYVGTEEPVDDSLVWIDTDGQPSSSIPASLVSFDDSIAETGTSNVQDAIEYLAQNGGGGSGADGLPALTYGKVKETTVTPTIDGVTNFIETGDLPPSLFNRTPVVGDRFILLALRTTTGQTFILECEITLVSSYVASKNIAVVETTGAQGEQGIQGPAGANGADGYTPIKGTDYWTTADQQQIVQDVLAALPDGDEVNY